MNINKKKLKIVIVGILLLTVLVLIFTVKTALFEKFSGDPEVTEEKDKVEEMTEEEIKYIISLPKGYVLSLAEDFFILELHYSNKKIKVNVSDETEFINLDGLNNQEKLVLIPEEHNDWLSQFYYVKNFIGQDQEKYEVFLYFDLKEDIGESKEIGIFETDLEEVGATYIAWTPSIYVNKDGFYNSEEKTQD